MTDYMGRTNITWKEVYGLYKDAIEAMRVLAEECDASDADAHIEATWRVQLAVDDYQSALWHLYKQGPEGKEAMTRIMATSRSSYWIERLQSMNEQTVVSDKEQADEYSNSN